MSVCNNSRSHATNVETLKTRAQFLRLRSGNRFRSSLFTIQSGSGDKALPEPVCHVGYTVTTKVGNSVERNRIKRRLRAAVASVFPGKAEAGKHYAIIAQRQCLSSSFSDITQELNRGLDHLANYKAKVTRPNNAGKPSRKH